MRWSVFIVAALLALSFDTSLSGLFALGTTVPQATPALAVFVLLGAPRMTALWACLILGLLADLAMPAALSSRDSVVIAGPHALGFLFAANVVLPLRSMVMRRNPLALGVLAGLFSMGAALVVVAFAVLRSWYPGAAAPFGGDGPAAELWRCALRAVYSGGLAVPLGWLLLRTTGLWGFPSRW